MSQLFNDQPFAQIKGQTAMSTDWDVLCVNRADLQIYRIGEASFPAPVDEDQVVDAWLDRHGTEEQWSLPFAEPKP